MKIGLDLRFLENDIYSNFVLKLVKNIIETKKEHDFIIYANSENDILKKQNSIVKNVEIKNGSFAEQTKFNKILKSDNLGLTIFFNHFKPINYKKDYIIFVADLKDLYYSNFPNSFARYKFQYLISKNIKNALKLICLDKITKNELVERFNVKENKISIIDGFFPQKVTNFFKNIDENEENLTVNIRTKYNIKNDFFIFSAGDSIEKNYEKLIRVWARLKQNNHKIDLVFLGSSIGANINLRNMILENNLQENIYFLGTLSQKEKKIIYDEALGTIFPSLYEPFPFRLTEPLYFDSPILASNLQKIENIFGNTIKYFSPISVNSIFAEVEKFIKNPEKIPDYSEIKKKFTLENTTKQFLEIID